MAMEVRDSTCESSFLFKLDVFENIHQDITSSCHPIWEKNDPESLQIHKLWRFFQYFCPSFLTKFMVLCIRIDLAGIC